MSELISLIIGILLMILLGSVFINLLPFILILLIIFVVYGFYKYYKFKKQVENEMNNQNGSYHYQNTYQNSNQTSDDKDIIDVEYTEKDAD